MKKKKEKGIEIDLGLGSIFRGIGNLVDLLSEMVEAGEEIKKTGELRGKGRFKDLRGVYGFSVRFGLGGTPEVESFGNIRQTREGPVVEEVREPLTDIFDEGDKIRVVAEVPGVAEGDIRTELKKDILTITAQGQDRKYSKEILLPTEAKPSSLTTSYRNGILELVLTKETKA